VKLALALNITYFYPPAKAEKGNAILINELTIRTVQLVLSLINLNLYYIIYLFLEGSSIGGFFL
jgi:hypothetical protein